MSLPIGELGTKNYSRTQRSITEDCYRNKLNCKKLQHENKHTQNKYIDIQESTNSTNKTTFYDSLVSVFLPKK